MPRTSARRNAGPLLSVSPWQSVGEGRANRSESDADHVVIEDHLTSFHHDVNEDIETSREGREEARGEAVVEEPARCSGQGPSQTWQLRGTGFFVLHADGSLSGKQSACCRRKSALLRSAKQHAQGSTSRLLAGHLLHQGEGGGWESSSVVGRQLTSYRECTRDQGARRQEAVARGGIFPDQSRRWWVDATVSLMWRSSLAILLQIGAYWNYHWSSVMGLSRAF